MKPHVRDRARALLARRLPLDTVWERALPTESDFWREWMTTEGMGWPADFRRRFDPETPLQEPLLLEAIGEQPVVRILEVGSGPATWLGQRHPSAEIEITPTDALADLYDELLAEVGLVPPVRTLAVPGEEIGSRFEAGSFDLAYARNALDHSADPAGIVDQMVSLVRPGGTVALRHFREEGETMRYQELHQWNFSVRDGALLVWNKRDGVDLSALLEPVAEVVAYEQPNDQHAPWVLASIRKR